MAQEEKAETTRLIGIIGRSLAYLSLHYSGLKAKDLATQGAFLEGLGLSRKEAARLLNTTEESLRVLASRARRTKRQRHVRKRKKDQER